MSEEEFEDIFGNVPFENIKKIQKYIKNNYIRKDKIEEKLKYYKTLYEIETNRERYLYLKGKYKMLEELLILEGE